VVPPERIDDIYIMEFAIRTNAFTANDIRNYKLLPTIIFVRARSKVPVFYR
jgi:hypothetical protein